MGKKQKKIPATMLIRAEDAVRDIFAVCLSISPKFSQELTSAFSLMFPDISFQNASAKKRTSILPRDPHVYWTQNIFSKEHRKKQGIYYTDYDLADYVITNLVYNHFESKAHVYPAARLAKELEKLPSKQSQKFLFEQTFLDPTCGSGEFLVSSFKLKKYLCDKCKTNVQDKEWLSICKTIYGNDIEHNSIYLAKARMFCEVFPLLKQKKSILELAKILNVNFSSQDWIAGPIVFNKTFDYIVGNPPYVEYGKYNGKHLTTTDCGNVYADVILNSYRVLAQDGCIGFIVPLSYISTTRMSSLRQFIIEHSKKQVILNFADRPSCLFPGVHQKINIVFAFNGTKLCKTYTSSYQYWYKAERDKVLNTTKLVNSIDLEQAGFPKIGDEVSKSIFNKITTAYSSNLYDSQVSSGNPIYLNMRAAFWIKAFSTYQKSAEYKSFTYDANTRPFVLCLLNSSLFWLYWITLSDCWHITRKELRNLTIPTSIKRSKQYSALINRLEEKLEKTKKYIGTKQTDYEYKHKFCKPEIDAIDNALAKEYNLTQKELQYIKNFALKYRMGEE